MEVKKWSYEEYPEFCEPVDGATWMETSGDEIGVYLHANVEYVRVQDVPLHLHILEPFTRNDPERIYPCLVYVQGSAWAKQWMEKLLAQYANLAKLGYVIAVVEYRHSGIAPFPAVIQDTRNAVRFMKKYAAQYHADANCVFLGGCSSGGHAAMFAGLLKEGDPMDASQFEEIDTEVRGILNYYGAVSLLMEDGYPSTINHGLPDSAEGKMMGGVNLREDRRLRERGSVETYLTEEIDLAPVWIIHGTKDRIVNPEQSVRLYQKLRALGKDAELVLLKGADHGGAEFWTEEVCRAADTFMKKHF